MSLDTRDDDPQGIKRKREGPGSKRRASLAYVRLSRNYPMSFIELTWKRCDTCRRQKEKCEGGPPCWRCQRLRTTGTQESDVCGVPTASSPVPTDSDQRVQNLEHIVRHFLGDVPLDEENISRIALKCSEKNSEMENLLDVNESFDVQFVSRNVAFYSGEFSHWNFSEKLRRTTSSNKDTPAPGVKEYWRPTHLQSSIHIVTEVIAQLPPEPIATFLIGVFFKFAEGNAFYLEKEWVYEKLHLCYDGTTDLSANDIPWLCSLFSVLAIGTQMAHMEDDRSNPNSGETEEAAACVEDSVGLVFYHVASKLVPDVILAASYESVQAFVLLATWALPVSAGGLSYTYLGLAMKMAIQNGMHRKYAGGNGDSRTIELRNRLFWSAYTLEKRTSIMHGRPASIARSEINADLPTDCPGFESPRFPNMTAWINLGSWMGEVAETLTQFKRCPKRLLLEYSERLLRLKNSMKQWWGSLPTTCHDSNPQGLFFRQNSHLKLSYLLIFIYMGRPFIFHNDTKDRSLNESQGVGKSYRSELVNNCVESALEMLAILQSLADNIGLCRASYNEFSSCRAALLVILAETLNSGKSKRLQDGLTRGMTLIRQMIGGTASQSEISYIESIEAAIRQLSSHDESGRSAESTTNSSSSAYATFKNWTQSMKSKSSGNILELSSFSPMSGFTSGGESVFHPDMSELTEFLNPEWPSANLELDAEVFFGQDV
ncbi:hypothetical protein N7448_001683 [Penicillium atrosanguineum]|nr:hypothetical protein N7526_004652 [Penicillium atrosanguineum]KAJ5150105.1 hypothetical protein N7448_001683 [Penicillium atrosanguineum]